MDERPQLSATSTFNGIPSRTCELLGRLGRLRSIWSCTGNITLPKEKILPWLVTPAYVEHIPHAVPNGTQAADRSMEEYLRIDTSRMDLLGAPTDARQNPIHSEGHQTLPWNVHTNDRWVSDQRLETRSEYIEASWNFRTSQDCSQEATKCRF